MEHSCFIQISTDLIERVTDRRRKGSLAWYNNSKSGLRSLIPVHTKRPHMYFVKVGMDTKEINGVYTPVTLLQKVPHRRISPTSWSIDFSKLEAKRTRRKQVIRQIKTNSIEENDLQNEVLGSKKLDAISITKGRGTLGVVARRNVKMQKRKAAGSGCARKPGSMGLRTSGRVVYTKPFMGQTGNSRRTIFGLENLGLEEVENYSRFKYYIKKGTLLLVKGSVGGPIGRTVLIRSSIRK